MYVCIPLILCLRVVTTSEKETADRGWSEYKNDFSDKAVQGFKLYFS